MSESSVSWIGLALSALLVLDKLLSKSKKVKCKCCGSEFEASEILSTPISPKIERHAEPDSLSIKLETVKVEHKKTEATTNKE